MDVSKLCTIEMTVHDFNVFVGAESGLLKGVSISSKANLAKNFVSSKKAESSRKDEEITCMCWGNEDKEILVGLRNRTVKVGYRGCGEI